MNRAVHEPSLVRGQAGSIQLTVEQRDVDLVAISVCVAGGYLADPVGLPGVAHLVEHLLFRAEKDIRSRDHVEQLSEIGSMGAANTLPDTTEYWLSGGGDLLSQLLHNEASRLRSLDLAAEVIDLEKTTLLQELETDIAISPLADRGWCRQMAAHIESDHSPWHDGFGNADSMARATRQDLLDYYERWYRGSQIAVHVHAPDDPQAVIDLAVAAFDGFIDAPAQELELPRALKETARIVDEIPGQGVRVTVSSLLPDPVSEPDDYAAHLVLATLLASEGVPSGVGRHGPLTAGSPDIAMTWAIAPDLTDAFGLLRQALGTCATPKVEQWLPAARLRTALTLGLSVDMPVQHARLAARGMLLRGDPGWLDTVRSATQRVSQEHVSRAAGRMLEALS